MTSPINLSKDNQLALSGPKTPAISAKVRDKAATLERLQSALLRVINGAGKLSIKAVAEEAGVTPSLIHHVYPEVAEQIRVRVGRSTRSQRDAKHAELLEAQRMIANQKAEIKELQANLASIASINLKLQDRIDELEAQLQGKVVSIRLRSRHDTQ